MDHSAPALFREIAVRPDLGSRPRLSSETWPAAVYVIGDVHGCLAQLQRIHDKIVADARGVDGDKLIICLGDYIDRGTHSAGVIRFLRQPPPAGFQRICLAGNHEGMMLDYYDTQSGAWLANGGTDTLISYGISPYLFLQSPAGKQAEMLREGIPAGAVAWMRSLPVALTLPGACFVHAGLRAGIPLTEQMEEDLLWIRPRDLRASESDPFVVHGHTPAGEPVVAARRICVDTAAFITGTLTAVRLTENLQPKFINVDADEIFS
jgi:serine/threonine protein phosphatase 1